MRFQVGDQVLWYGDVYSVTFVPLNQTYVSVARRDKKTGEWHRRIIEIEPLWDHQIVWERPAGQVHFQPQGA